jgi:hydroxymethylbilane synthase
MATRLAKADAFDAIVVAAAALDRLGLAERITEVLDVSTLLPQVGQGALAVECRAGDDDVLARLVAIEHEPSRRAVDAERGFLAELGGDCSLPAGAHAVATDDGGVRLEAMLASADGRVVLRHRAEGVDDVEVVGRAAARYLLDNGGTSLLDR